MCVCLCVHVCMCVYKGSRRELASSLPSVLGMKADAVRGPHSIATLALSLGFSHGRTARNRFLFTINFPV